MIVAEKKWNSKRPIVAAVDLSSKLRVKQRLNQEIIATAKRYAEVLGCPLVVLNALHIPPILTELDLVDEFTQARKLTHDLQPKLLKLSRAHGLDLKQFRLKQGPVDKVITSESARLKAQLVVMGTVGRKGIKARLMGNTAEHVLSKLRTDVLALKP
jgi:universal stress protein E